MSTRRLVSLIVGAVVTVATLVVIMMFILYGGYFAEKDRIVVGSIALGPVLMMSVMVGYAVWWGLLFLLTLVLRPESLEDRDSYSGP